MNAKDKQKILRILGKYSKALNTKRSRLFDMLALDALTFITTLKDLQEATGAADSAVNAMIVIKFKNYAQAMERVNAA